MAINYPRVEKETVRQFAKRWDHKGIKMILDDTSVQFAMDFANVAMRSYVDDMIEKAADAKRQREAYRQAAQVIPPDAEPVKSSIVLTDQ